MSDLFSRRDVVECVYKALRTPPLKGVFTDTMSLAIRMVNDLPSAQPEIIRCKDCVNHIDDRCTVADHHVAPFSCCQSVFEAKNRGKQE